MSNVCPACGYMTPYESNVLTDRRTRLAAAETERNELGKMFSLLNDQRNLDIERYEAALQQRAERDRDTLRADLGRCVEAINTPCGEHCLGCCHHVNAALSPSAVSAGKEWARMQLTEMNYRKELWLNHGHSGQYGDDGEMQCSECIPFGLIDYEREPIDKVERVAEQARMVRTLWAVHRL